MKRRLYTLDVFTTKQYAGNPLAVVTDGDGIPQAKMQAIAREMNLSETVFVQRPTNNRALARLRIFTTTRELPLAGHPVIGTWFLLAELGVVPASEGHVQIRQQTGAGILPVEFSFHDGRPVRVTMTQKPARFVPTKLNRAALAEPVGPEGDRSRTVVAPRICFHRDFESDGSDPSQKYVAENSYEYASTGAIDFARRRGGILLRARQPRQSIRSRHAALGIGGRSRDRSAGGSLGAYLVRHERLRHSENLTIMQGVEMGRPSEIQVEITSERGRSMPKVAARPCAVFEGHIEA